MRKGLDLEKLGIVAEIAEIESLLELGTSGKFGKRRWTAVGQVQLDHGRGPWNEWCLLFDDGSWGWLAEAQGEIMLTVPKEVGSIPPYDRLGPGDAVDLGTYGHFIVAEVGQGKVTAVKGELPALIRPGETTYYADLSGKKNAFATLDYGDDRICDAVYVGREVTPKEVGLDPRRAPGVARRADASRIQCTSCGGEIKLRDPDGAIRVACQSCGSLLDATDPSHRIVGRASRIEKLPDIPLGQRGRLRGLDVEVIALLLRSVTVSGIRYGWREYLLKTRGHGYRWLVEQKKHWLYVEPINVGDVKFNRSAASYAGETFDHFESGMAEVDGVFGEVYWEVTVGETVRTHDYIAPPRSLSIEETPQERSVSLGIYIDGDELKTAFKLKEGLGRPRGVASTQENPHKPQVKAWAWIVLPFVGVDLLLSILYAGMDKHAFMFPCCLTFPLLLMPLVVVFTKSSNFETQRWADSDHPRGGE